MSDDDIKPGDRFERVDEWAGWKPEDDVDRLMIAYAGVDGISPDALPPARASSYVPKCAELAGWGSWDGRQRK